MGFNTMGWSKYSFFSQIGFDPFPKTLDDRIHASDIVQEELSMIILFDIYIKRHLKLVDYPDWHVLISL
jgi:hypothetical protein